MRAKLSLLAIGIYTIACYDPPTTYSFVHHFFQLTLAVVQIRMSFHRLINAFMNVCSRWDRANHPFVSSQSSFSFILSLTLAIQV